MKPNYFYKIPQKYKNYKIQKIDSGASKRLFYRLSNDSKSVIFVDSSDQKNDYINLIGIYNYLSKINISIPIIYENDDKNCVLIIEDFGNLRFDKIIDNYSLKKLLSSAVETLIILRNEFIFDKSKTLLSYNYNTLLSEISEFPNYFYPYACNKKIPDDLALEFYECWKNNFDLLKFNFNNFVHKDFNLNNLMFLPSRTKHLKCGVLDFQSAFWGEDSWDLFSLLEDSRIFFDEQYNDYFINFFYNATNQEISLNDFKNKYYLLNCSRQTRLLGRWVKLSKNLNQDFYLKFIETTKKRLHNGLLKLNNEDLKLIYKKLIPDFF